jgi:hypothetical protein
MADPIIPALPGDPVTAVADAVAEIASLANTLAKYLTDPAGYARKQLLGKLDDLHQGMLKAITTGNARDADIIFAEYNRLYLSS